MRDLYNPINKLNGIFDWFTRLLAFWTIVAVITGYLFPFYFTIFRAWLDYLFMFSMLGIGLVLDPKEFAPILREPWLPLLGTLTQFVVMPLAAFMIAELLELPPTLALGLIVAGSVPGAMASNVISYLAHADVALSISITTTSTLLAPILTPLFTFMFANTYVPIDYMEMFNSISIMVVLPLCMGLALRQSYKTRIEKIQSFFPAVSTLFIALICGLIVALNKDRLLAITPSIFIAIITLNLVGLLGGYTAGWFYHFNTRRKKTLAIEVGMQNAGLGALLALKHFSAEAALPPALFATWCILTASALATLWGRRLRHPEDVTTI